jgi:hypothetical protein
MRLGGEPTGMPTATEEPHVSISMRAVANRPPPGPSACSLERSRP